MRNWAILAIMMLSLASTSCSKDDDKEEDETELITTMRVVVQEVGGGAPVTFTFRDPDGPGGATPTIDNILLTNNRQYNVGIQLLNESETPAEDKTPEILAEANDHQFYYAPTGANVTVSNLNLDSRGLPLGLSSTWNVTAASTGTMRITLKHKPGAKAAGDPVTKGETDIEVDFPVTVR